MNLHTLNLHTLNLHTLNLHTLTHSHLRTSRVSYPRRPAGQEQKTGSSPETVPACGRHGDHGRTVPTARGFTAWGHRHEQDGRSGGRGPPVPYGTATALGPACAAAAGGSVPTVALSSGRRVEQSIRAVGRKAINPNRLPSVLYRHCVGTLSGEEPKMRSSITAGRARRPGEFTRPTSP